MAVLVALVLLVLVMLAVLVVASCWRFDTWRRKGIPFPRPWPVFGNCMSVVLQREPLYITLDRIYQQFPDKPYIGFFGGPSPVLLVNDSDAIKDITVKDFNIFQNHKLSPDPHYDKVFSKFPFCQLDAEWKTTRTKLTPAFTSGRLKAMYGSVNAKAKQFVEILREKTSKNRDLNINELSSRYGIDLIASLAFGIEAGALRSDEPPPFMKAVAAAFRFGVKESLTTFALLFSPLVYHAIKVPILQDWRAALLTKLLKESSEYREREPPRNKDIFDLLLQIRRNGELPNDVFEAQVLSMQVAGSETTAAAVMFALWELALYPDCQDRLREELREDVDKAEGQITYEMIHDNEYLDMVHKETLRLWPVMPWLDRVASQDYVLPGTSTTIEKGTVVMIPVYSIQRDPKYFADPDTFDPERFARENAANRNKLTWLPFGNGPRSCIGSRFADMSVKTAIAQTVLNFRIDLAENSPKTHDAFPQCPNSFIITHAANLPLRFEPL